MLNLFLIFWYYDILNWELWTYMRETGQCMVK